MALTPSKQVCPLCGIDDGVEVLGIRDGRWLFSCYRTVKHETAFQWTSADVAPEEDDAEPGVMESFGLFDDLPKCLKSGGAFVEYGIVEHRYRTLRPAVFSTLLDTYGHRAIEEGRPYTTSSFLASSLRILANRGELELRWGPATGFWAYNGTLSYWALSPATGEAMESWATFALDQGIDPDILGVT